MNQPVKAIIFDLDGVIIDSNPAIVAFWSDWANKYGFQLTPEMILEWVYGRKVTATIEGLFSMTNQEQRMEIAAAGYAFDASMHPIGIAGIQDFVQQLRQFNFPRGVVTSSHKERMEQMLERVGLSNCFSSSITAHDVQQGKPDPEPYVKMATKLQLNPSECLVFEDAISGVQSAIAAGMNCIGIGDASTVQRLKKEGATEVIPHFKALLFQQRTMITSNGNKYPLIV